MKFLENDKDLILNYKFSSKEQIVLKAQFYYSALFQFMEYFALHFN